MYQRRLTKHKQTGRLRKIWEEKIKGAMKRTVVKQRDMTKLTGDRIKNERKFGEKAQEEDSNPFPARHQKRLIGYSKKKIT